MTGAESQISIRMILTSMNRVEIVEIASYIFIEFDKTHRRFGKKDTHRGVDADESRLCPPE